MESWKKSVDRVFELFAEKGQADYIGEAVSQLEHACQAGELAIAAGADDDVVLAAFFHDIGHLAASKEASNMAGFGVERHESIGANYLRQLGFPERIAWLVESHVQAKRYLTHCDPEYLAGLSEASRKTLDWQGGPMTEEEAIVFENDPDFDIIIQLRRWDEEAKIEGKPLPDLNVFRERCLRLF